MAVNRALYEEALVERATYLARREATKWWQVLYALDWHLSEYFNNIKTYDVKNVRVFVAGVELTDFADDSFIEVERVAGK